MGNRMKILTIGASGTIGKAIVEKLSSDGHEVIAVSRKTTPSVNIDDSAGLQKFLSEMDPVDHIVCTGGGVHFGPESVDELTDDQIMVGIQSKLMGQVNVMRHGYKKLNKGGSILVTGGIIAHKPIFPKAAHVGLVCSGLNGFVVGLANDLEDSGVRINVIHPPLLKETATSFGMSGDGIPDAKEAAEAYAKCLFSETGTGQQYFLEGHGPN